jgi:hypothetical protein
MRTSIRGTLSTTLRAWGALAAAGLASLGSVAASAPFAACQPEQVVTPPACNDPCCSGNVAAIDCGKYPTLACTEPGNPCTARDYGCANGLYYLRASVAAPATCNAVEAGLAGDDGGGAFEDLDAGDESPDDSSTAAPADVSADVSPDAAPAAGDAALDAPDASGDASPDAS